MVDAELREALAVASLTSELKFDGLIETVRELLSFTEIKINNVKRRSECFKVDFQAACKNGPDVENLIKQYCERNGDIEGCNFKV